MDRRFESESTHLPDPYAELTREFEVIINSSAEGIWVCDGQANVLRINPASERINNIRADMVQGRNMRDLTRAGIIDHSVTLEVLQHKKTINILQTTKDQKKLLVTGTPVFNEKDEIVRVVVNERDISEFEQLKEDLLTEKAKQKELYHQLNELQSFESIADKIVARSENISTVLKMAIKIAPSEATVMLLGETGTGKGILADFIHQHSNRKDRAFIKINCGAIPESLIESELFGYAPWAFTGASSDGKAGKFELAHEGTLFLDEIGDLPQTAQVKILHFLEDGRIFRVGGRTPRELDVRIIAATNKDLNQLMAQRDFRPDLFYRLNVIPLELPPLRERKECLFPLLQRFLEQFAATFKGQAPPAIAPRALKALLDYRYPGNVRELINVCERLVALSGEGRIELEALPEKIRKKSDRDSSRKIVWNGGTTLKQELLETERRILTKAKKICKNQEEIARVLDIGQSTVARKLKKYRV